MNENWVQRSTRLLHNEEGHTHVTAWYLRWPPNGCADIVSVDEGDLLTSQSTYGDLKSTVSFD
jgi:hypothetical protein